MDFLLSFVRDAWATLEEMAPYLLFGFGVAGALSVVMPRETVQRHLGGRGLGPVVKASLFGVPLPLCSCGVIPVAMSLRKHRASRGATVSFLLSTPQTGVDSIIVTYGMLGPVFAIVRPVAAFVTGVLGGWLTDRFETPAQRAEDERRAGEGSEEDGAAHKKRNPLARGLKFAFVTLPEDIGRAMLGGILIAALISAVVPNDFFAGVLGTGLLSMLAMMALGIPMYVCATASIPIAVALIDKGVSPGAALVFLITGPATNAAAITTIWRVLGPRTVYIYLSTIASSALLCGFLLDFFFTVTKTPAAHMHHAMLAPWIGTASAIVLLALLGYAMIASAVKARKKE